MLKVVEISNASFCFNLHVSLVSIISGRWSSVLAEMFSDRVGLP